jgi:hypothetical protein
MEATGQSHVRAALPPVAESPNPLELETEWTGLHDLEERDISRTAGSRTTVPRMFSSNLCFLLSYLGFMALKCC